MQSISYVRTISDYRGFVCEAQRRALGWWPTILSFLTGLVPMLIAIPVASVWRLYKFEALGLGVLIATITQLVIQLVSARFLMTRHAKSRGAVLGDFKTVLTDQCIEGTGPHFTSRNEWAGVDAVTTSRSLLIIWVDTSVGIFIPRNAFATTADEAAFIAYANERIAASRAPAAN